MGGLLSQAAAHFMLSQSEVLLASNCCCHAVGWAAQYNVVDPNLVSFQLEAISGHRGGGIQKPTL